MKYEEAISHILPLEQRECANLYSHFNEYRFQSEIRRLVKRIADGERIIDYKRNVIVQLDEDKIVNSEILHNTVRWLYRIAEKRCFDDGEEVYCDYMNYLQALDVAMETSSTIVMVHMIIFVVFVCAMSVGGLSHIQMGKFAGVISISRE